MFNSSFSLVVVSTKITRSLFFFTLRGGGLFHFIAAVGGKETIALSGTSLLGTYCFIPLGAW